MRIIPYEAAHAAPLHRIYRDRTDDLPHCRFGPSAGYFAATVASPSLARTTLFVAEDAAGVRGFAALLDMPARRAETSAPAPAPQEAPAAQGNQTKAEITACFA